MLFPEKITVQWITCFVSGPGSGLLLYSVIYQTLGIPALRSGVDLQRSFHCALIMFDKFTPLLSLYLLLKSEECRHTVSRTALTQLIAIKQQFFTCNHGTKNHCYGDEISVSKQAPEAVFNSASPPEHLIEDKGNGHAQQAAVFYNESLVPWSIRVQLLKSLGLSGV